MWSVLDRMVRRRRGGVKRIVKGKRFIEGVRFPLYPLSQDAINNKRTKEKHNMNELNHDNKYDRLHTACEELIEALTQNTETLWEDSLQESHSCVLWDKKTLQPNPYDEGGESKTYPGIYKEVEEVKKIVEFWTSHPLIDTEEALEKKGYVLEEFAVDNIVDRVFQNNDDCEDYDISQVEDFVRELIEDGYGNDYGVHASDTDELMMNEGDIADAYDIVDTDIEKIHEYIRTGGF